MYCREHVWNNTNCINCKYFWIVWGTGSPCGASVPLNLSDRVWVPLLEPYPLLVHTASPPVHVAFLPKRNSHARSQWWFWLLAKPLIYLIFSSVHLLLPGCNSCLRGTSCLALGETPPPFWKFLGFGQAAWRFQTSILLWYFLVSNLALLMLDRPNSCDNKVLFVLIP